MEVDRNTSLSEQIAQQGMYLAAPPLAQGPDPLSRL